MNNETHIVSMIICCLPEKMNDAVIRAKALAQAECYTGENPNKFVLVFEAASESEVSNQMDQINTWDGVLSAQLCYHHCETNESLQEEINHETHAA